MDELSKAVKSGDRRALARAITLVESDNPEHRAQAAQLLKDLAATRAIRVGITGSPGVGKSTLIESLGMFLLEKGHRVAVLAVDPTSPLSKGSILGDKTRMQTLSKDTRAFIRPSPSRGLLGGVAPHSEDAITLLEGAGFDVVLVETVGVGQSEVSVAQMVDTFVLLVSPTSGDELQGVKKGIMEVAHIVAVTKHDGDLKARAEQTKHHYGQALSTGKPLKSGKWRPQTLLVSAHTGEGVAELWESIKRHQEGLEPL